MLHSVCYRGNNGSVFYAETLCFIREAQKREEGERGGERDLAGQEAVSSLYKLQGKSSGDETRTARVPQLCIYLPPVLERWHGTATAYSIN